MSNLDARFRQKIQVVGDCWEWTGSTSQGYGRFRADGRSVFVHRWAYERFRGPIPAGLTIDHLCRNRRCANPDHLEPVTNRENVLRGEGITAQHARKTHCPQGHEYTPENIYSWPGRPNGRLCRECMRVKGRSKPRPPRKPKYEVSFHRRTEACLHGHPWTEATSYYWRGIRQCRICLRDRDRERRERNRARSK